MRDETSVLLNALRAISSGGCVPKGSKNPKTDMQQCATQALQRYAEQIAAGADPESKANLRARLDSYNDPAHAVSSGGV